MINVADFKKIFPQCKDAEEWVEALERELPANGIDTRERAAAFIAQCGHESAGWSRFEENLNYSAKALNAVFPKYFKRAGRDANLYHRQPEKIANVVYANRMGNGDIESGDGWKYRGRGAIQLTGKNNYKAFSEAFGIDAVSNPDTVAEDKDVAIQSAIWFWNVNNLNEYADRGDIVTMTQRINGGTNGLEERKIFYSRLMRAVTED